MKAVVDFCKNWRGQIRWGASLRAPQEDDILTLPLGDWRSHGRQNGQLLLEPKNSIQRALLGWLDLVLVFIFKSNLIFVTLSLLLTLCWLGDTYLDIINMGYLRVRVCLLVLPPSCLPSPAPRTLSFHREVPRQDSPHMVSEARR